MTINLTVRGRNPISIAPAFRWMLTDADFLVVGGDGGRPHNLIRRGAVLTTPVQGQFFGGWEGPGWDVGVNATAKPIRIDKTSKLLTNGVTICAIFRSMTSVSDVAIVGNYYPLGTEGGYSLYVNGTTQVYLRMYPPSNTPALTATVTIGDWYACIAGTAPGIGGRLILRNLRTGIISEATSVHVAPSGTMTGQGVIGDANATAFGSRVFRGYISQGGYWHRRWTDAQMRQWALDPWAWLRANRMKANGKRSGTAYTQSVGGILTPAGTIAKQTGKIFAGGLTPAGAISKRTSKTPSGSLTPAGALTKQTNRTLAGAMTPAGALAKQTNKTFAGSLTPAGTISKRTSRALSGSLTPAGALSKQTNRTLAGGITPSGALVTAKTHPLTLSGTLTPAGALAKQTNKTFAGTLTPAGAISKSTSRTLSGALTPAGALTKFTSRTFAGSLTPAGALTKRTSRTLSGALTPSGTLAAAKTHPITLSGSLTPAGTLAKQTNRSLAGALTPAGALSKQTRRTLSGALTPTGALTKSASRTLSGALTPAGTLTKITSRSLSGTVTPTGALTKQTSRSLAGVLTPSGTLTSARIFLRTLSGSLTPSGTLSKQTNRTLSGSLTPSGAISKRTSRTLSGALTPSGTLATARTHPLTLSGSLTPAGALTKRTNKTLSGTISGLASLLVDDAVKADSTTSPGSPQVGGPWVPWNSLVWGIDSHYLYNPAGDVDAVLAADIGVVDQDVTLIQKTSNFAHSDGIMIRGTDASNFLAVSHDDAIIYLIRETALATHTVQSGPFWSGGAFIAGTEYTMRVVVIGNNIDVYINGVLETTFTLAGADTTRYVGTFVGIWSNNDSSQRIRGISASAATASPMTGTLSKQTRRTLTGSLTPSGTISKRTSRTLTGSLTPSGVLSKQTRRTLSGSLTPVGAITKQTNRTLSGVLTPSGTLTSARIFLRTLSGSVTPAGSITKQTNRSLSGALTPAGALTKQTRRSLSGALTPSGTLVKQTNRSLSGSLTPTGTLSKQGRKTLSGSLTPAGALSKQTRRTLAGSLTPSGTITKSVSRSLAGVLTPSGALTKQTNRSFAGSLTQSGALSKQTNKVLGGTVAPTGALVKRTNKSFAGSLTPAGSITKRVGKALAGVIFKNYITPAPDDVNRNFTTLFTDPVSRADDATTPGNGWTVVSGVVGVLGGHLYFPNGVGGEIATKDAGDFITRIDATISSPNYTNYKPILILRWLNASNYLYAIPRLGTLQLRQVISGVDTSIVNGFAALVPLADGVPATIRAEFDNVRLTKLYLNGSTLDDNVISVNIGTTAGSLLQAKTVVGFGFQNITTPLAGSSDLWVDDVSVYTTRVGSLSKQTFRSLGGSLTPSGAVTKQTNRTLSATLAPVGTLFKRVGKLLEGVLEFIGVLEPRPNLTAVGDFTAGPPVMEATALEIIPVVGDFTAGGDIFNGTQSASVAAVGDFTAGPDALSGTLAQSETKPPAGGGGGTETIRSGRRKKKKKPETIKVSGSFVAGKAKLSGHVNIIFGVFGVFRTQPRLEGEASMELRSSAAFTGVVGAISGEASFGFDIDGSFVAGGASVRGSATMEIPVIVIEPTPVAIEPEPVVVPPEPTVEVPEPIVISAIGDFTSSESSFLAEVEMVDESDEEEIMLLLSMLRRE